LIILLNFILNSNLVTFGNLVQFTQGTQEQLFAMNEYLAYAGVFSAASLGTFWVQSTWGTVRPFGSWAGDGVLWGQAAAFLQEDREQVPEGAVPSNGLQISPFLSTLPMRLNTTGKFFPLWTTVLRTVAVKGITFQESRVAFEKPCWCLSSVCRGLEGSKERRWVMRPWGGRGASGGAASAAGVRHFQCSLQLFMEVTSRPEPLTLQNSFV
jgi:hypothetical protein